MIRRVPAVRAAVARPAPNWRRRIKWIAITLVTLLVVVSVGTYFWADSKLHRDIVQVIDRPDTRARARTT